MTTEVVCMKAKAEAATEEKWKRDMEWEVACLELQKVFLHFFLFSCISHMLHIIVNFTMKTWPFV